MFQTTIYLNRAKHNNQELVRLLYKPDDRIAEIIKKNDWIKFHTELKSFCVKNSKQNINLLKDLFEGIATVNTYYLTASPKVKADEIIINKAISFNQILPAANKVGSLLLLPFNNNGVKIILLKYKQNQETYNSLKQADYLLWHSKHKTFYFKAKKSQK